jgi:hypothetical protein
MSNATVEWLLLDHFEQHLAGGGGQLLHTERLVRRYVNPAALDAAADGRW